MCEPKEKITGNELITKCELCGSTVKVVGDTTKHYEPYTQRAEVVMGEFDREFREYSFNGVEYRTNKGKEWLQSFINRVLKGEVG